MGRFYSDTLESAVRLLYFQPNAKRYPEAIRLLEQAVEKEEPDAYYFLSRCYAWEEGGISGDESKAKQLLKTGIELGSDLCILGADRMSALQGDLKAAMKHSLADAFAVVEQRAEAGEPMAQYAAGLFYFWGDMLMGIQKPGRGEFDRYEKENGQAALKWFCAAGEQGCLPAIRNGYHSQRKGQNGVKQDVNRALQWMEKLKDTFELGALYYDVALEYSRQNKYKDAIRWYEMGIAHGNGDCASGLAELYQNGEGVKEDKKKAFELLKSAEDTGAPYVYHNLARCYYYGKGTPEDNATAFYYFQKAAQLDVESSQYFVSYCYYMGQGVTRDYGKAFEWATRAAEGDIPAATVLLGLCYLHGHGVAQDMVKGRAILEKYVQEYDNDDAYYALGMVYDKGMGVPEDVDMAVEYYQKAIAQGSDLAEEALARFKKTLFGKWKRR